MRLALSTRHCRRLWNWSEKLRLEAVSWLKRWSETGTGSAAKDEVRVYLDNDLDKPATLAVTDDAIEQRKGRGTAVELIVCVFS